jgi:hypothetical protein
MTNAGFGGVALYRNAIVQYARTKGYSEEEVEAYFRATSSWALSNFLKQRVVGDGPAAPGWLETFGLEGSNSSKTLEAQTRRVIERAKLTEFRELEIPNIDWNFEKKKLITVMDLAAARYGFSRIKNMHDFPGSGFSRIAFSKYFEYTKCHITIGYDTGSRNELSIIPCLSLIHFDGDKLPMFLGDMQLIIPEIRTYSIFFHIQESDDEIIRFEPNIKSATLGVFAMFEANDFFGNSFISCRKN